MIDIVEALDDPNLLGVWFAGPSWATWKVVLKAAFAISMDEEELALFAHSEPAWLETAVLKNNDWETAAPRTAPYSAMSICLSAQPCASITQSTQCAKT